MFVGPGLVVLEETPVRFHCGCSQDRVERALKLLGREELTQLSEGSPSEPTALVCEFCRTGYQVSAERLRILLDELDEELADDEPKG